MYSLQKSLILIERSDSNLTVSRLTGYFNSSDSVNIEDDGLVLAFKFEEMVPDISGVFYY